MRFFLCGQTGNINRGCEAIIRSTVKVLEQKNGNVYFATFDEESDRKMARELGITMISYAQYPTPLHRYACAAVKKMNKKSLAGLSIIEKPLFDMITKDDICINVGGDVYCYGRPTISLALNRFTQKNNIPNILWCCSVEKDNIKGEIRDDLKKYKYIFAREQITYDNLVSSGIPEERIVKCCDPAFFLDKKAVDLPKGFVEGNTVGINVSELVVKEENSIVYESVIMLINYILENTDMGVCLIPHVYGIKTNRNDYPILKKIYNEINNKRVSIIDKEYDCEQLKYIISKCRMFYGARTHSTIAAYSSGVPTVVIGYSVKSKGIATDLFGTYDKYVLPYDDIKQVDDLVKSFNWLRDNEDVIKNRLTDFLPVYKQSLLDGIEKYIKNDIPEETFTICDEMQCTGCLACVDMCPNNCISVIEDEYGFERPQINFEKCVKCGICRNKCPVANKPKDDSKSPDAYAAINNDTTVRLKSSSGGIFYQIANCIIKNGGVVVGAAFDSDYQKVSHQICNSTDEINKLMGSKYVQSSTKDIYQQTEEILKLGKQVLFTGTPCQIAGLYAYLRQDYDNLFTQDLICHGVPSPQMWKEYLDCRKKEHSSEIASVSFRNKRDSWKKYALNIDFKNGNNYFKSVTEDVYMRGYLSHLFIRPSCTLCSFKQIHRQSDLTLGDFWGIDKISPENNDDKGVSLLLVNSVKGKTLIENILDNNTIIKVDFEDSIKYNGSYYKSTTASKINEKFYHDIKRKSFDEAVNKYYGKGFLPRIRRAFAKIF